MSGPFGSSQWMYASGGFYPYEIEQSLRFNDDDSAYLSRTPASAGNRKTWTWSGWVKRGNLNLTSPSYQQVFSAGTGGAARDVFFFDTDVDDTLSFFSTSGAVLIFRTNAVFRDASAWYHIVLRWDTTQATASDRVRLYVNGAQQTFSTANYPILNADTAYVNTAVAHYLGTHPLLTEYLDGYLTEVNFIDGTALDPTSFGEFKSGIWVPKAYSGAYGTNGFYLSFADSAAIGDDLSGNGNDWTANNLVATDVLLDSPTNNFATFNSTEPNLMSSGSATLSQGNLQSADGGTSSGLAARGTFWVSSGQHYCEVLAQSLGGTFSNIGVVKEDKTGVFYQNAGFRNPTAANGNTTAYGASYAAGDIIGIALDLDAGEVTFYKNNVSQGAVTGLSGSYTIGVGDGQNVTQYVYVANFGQDSSFAGNKTAQGNTDANGVGDFYYAPPSGFLALCTANLPDPVIDPAQDDVPADYFNTLLWSGNGSQTRSLTGLGFQPDLTWMKIRSGTTQDHQLYDVVRGAGGGKNLSSNTTAAEGTVNEFPDSDYGFVSSFDADGFSVDDGAVSTNGGYVNVSGRTYVAWNWLAGNGTASNTDGSITSTVSVNQKAGFSIVSYTGTQANGTVGHGLGAAPKVVISKSRTNANGWPTLHAPSGNYGLRLNSTGANDAANGNLFFQNTAPTSSVFSVGANDENNTSGGSMIAYCFAEVEGYSKFGSYTGNGSTDGPFVYCGFRPAFVMMKRTDSTGSWEITDATRTPENVVDKYLYANLSNAEFTFDNLDFLSNGFKLRNGAGGTGNNISGASFIFMAFAEQPFKFSNAR